MSMLEIDGSAGEGGGQVLRTSLSLSVLTGRPFRLLHIRANRSKPGLKPQHLTAVRAAATLCQAILRGDKLNSMTLEFTPQVRPTGGTYLFDVKEASEGGSAGAVTLVLQTVLWPLLFGKTPSQVVLRGGTHVPFSPPYHYIAEVARPIFQRMGAVFNVQLKAWGWYPVGGGEITAEIHPISHLQAISFEPIPHQIVQGVSAVTNLPAHIPNRMARRAHNLLTEARLQPKIQEVRDKGVGAGAGIFLWLPGAGFSSLGRKEIPADKVAETAVADLLAFVENGASVDEHLADQLLLPLALAHGSSTFTTNRLTQHTLTNANLLRQWLDVFITINGQLNQPAQISVIGNQFSAAAPLNIGY